VITKNVLANYSEVSQLKFTELGANDKNAALNIAMTYLNNDDGTKKYDGYGYSPGDPKHSGDVWIHRQYADGYGYFVDSFLYNLVLHEVGHAVGLKHPHEGTITSPLVHDQHEFSIMSYRSYAGAPLGATNDSGSFPQSLMMDDIAALQQMYGANFETRSGDTTYSFDPRDGRMFIDGIAQGPKLGSKIFGTIWDGGGHDTYDFSNYVYELRPDAGRLVNAR
jgi:serralysin